MKSLWFSATLMTAFVSALQSPATAQSLAWVESGLGYVLPGGRLGSNQDAGPLIAFGLERQFQPGRSVGVAFSYVRFKADDRQSAPLQDGSWLPVDLDLWTVSLQWVRVVDVQSTSIALALGLGADMFRSSTLFYMPDFRHVYPGVEIGTRVGWRPFARFEVVGEVRGHITVSSPDDTEALFEATGSRQGDEEGTRWLIYMPLMLGLRLRL